MPYPIKIIENLLLQQYKLLLNGMKAIFSDHKKCKLKSKIKQRLKLLHLYSYLPPEDSFINIICEIKRRKIA